MSSGVVIVGKVISGFTVFGQSPVNRWVIGVGTIPRGEVELVFAGNGSASGVLSSSLDAAIIVMVIFTTFLAPPLLQAVFQEPATVENMADAEVVLPVQDPKNS